ncbi:MAG: hypothetical protein GY946_30640, partial [bacterium]|nr:hypothetical protein [bacterium]
PDGSEVVEAEDIVLESSEPEPVPDGSEVVEAEDIVLESSESEPVPDGAEVVEAEDIVLEWSESEPVPDGAEVVEAREITSSAPAGEQPGGEFPSWSGTGDAAEALEPAETSETPGAQQAAEAIEAEQDAEREAPPDPFVGTTGSRVPGEEAGPGIEPEPAKPTGLSFDPELLIIYQQEVEQHLGMVSSALDRAEQIQELIPGEEIYRALHTIHGASRTADIASIAQLAGLMEKPLKSAIAQNMALDHEIVALYREGQRAIQAMTEELVATRQLPVISEDI